jgi:hypothetical protein
MNMEIRKKTKKAGMFVIALSVIIVVLFGVFETGILKTSKAQPIFPNEHLFVDATYLLKTSETNDTVNVTCTPYLTNIWSKESGEIKVIAYVIETKDNLAVYKNTVEIGKIAANSTAEIEMPVVLSNNSYKVDILIFENGKLVIKGTLTISAYPIYVWDEISRNEKQVWKLSNSIGDFEQIH